MSNDRNKRGVVLIMVVFVVALLGAIIMGMLQMNTEEIQIMRNHVRAVEALAIAEAGLNDALAQLRADADWDAGFTDKPFSGGAYTVTVETPQITSVAKSDQGYVARVEAEVSVASGGPPYSVSIDSFRVNE
jgi:Tfp pilus assembly protein PilX